MLIAFSERCDTNAYSRLNIERSVTAKETSADN